MGKQSKNLKKLTPEEEASLAGLTYLTPGVPGYIRKRYGKSFRYYDAKGRPVTDGRLKQRFKALVIPPAWENVWISPNPRSHIQVTGIDQKGRKQYRYHSEWRSQRDGSKFQKLAHFGKLLPTIREGIQSNLKAKPLSKDQVVATIVHLLENTLIRIGNEAYVKQNKSYGLTTIRDEHVEIDRSTIYFEFKGKSGIHHKVSLRDPRIAKIVAKCQDLPGQLLFQYLDETGEPRPVYSSDVNHFLGQITGSAFTAKDFRTWCASVLAAKVLREFDPPTSQTGGKRNVKAAITEVAKALRNTVSVCRKCYVHPKIIEAYLDGLLHADCAKKYQRLMKVHLANGLGEDEAFLLALLEGCDSKTKDKDKRLAA
jgi:DNA topoisomerase-1